MGESTGLDVREIAERLPHSYPLLLVDRVLEREEGRRVVALKNVTVNEDFFRGHFPGNPVMPGVLIVESMAQAAGLVVPAAPSGSAPRRSYLVGIEGARFRRPVVPGDALTLEVEVLRRHRRFWRFRATASVGAERAAEAELLLAVLEPGEGAE